MGLLFSDHDLDKAFVPYGPGRPQQRAELIGPIETGYSLPISIELPVNFKNPLMEKGPVKIDMDHNCDCGKCEDCQAVYFYLLR